MRRIILIFSLWILGTTGILAEPIAGTGVFCSIQYGDVDEFCPENSSLPFSPDGTASTSDSISRDFETDNLGTVTASAAASADLETQSLRAAATGGSVDGALDGRAANVESDATAFFTDWYLFDAAAEDREISWSAFLDGVIEFNTTPIEGPFANYVPDVSFQLDVFIGDGSVRESLVGVTNLEREGAWVDLASPDTVGTVDYSSSGSFIIPAGVDRFRVFSALSVGASYFQQRDLWQTADFGNTAGFFFDFPFAVNRVSGFANVEAPGSGDGDPPTTVSEPGTLVLLGAGLLGLGFTRKSWKA